MKMYILGKSLKAPTLNICTMLLRDTNDISKISVFFLGTPHISQITLPSFHPKQSLFIDKWVLFHFMQVNRYVFILITYWFMWSMVYVMCWDLKIWLLSKEDRLSNDLIDTCSKVGFFYCFILEIILYWLSYGFYCKKIGQK